MDERKMLKQIDELLVDPWQVDIKKLFDAFVSEPDEIKKNLYNALYTYVLRKRQMDVINTDSGDQETDQVVREIVAKWDYQRKNYFV